MLQPGVTIVISPLIALMKDQVDTLLRHRIPASYINSSLTPTEQNAEIDRLRNGLTKIVYIAPERFRNRSFLQAISQIDVSLMAVDEATAYLNGDMTSDQTTSDSTARLRLWVDLR